MGAVCKICGKDRMNDKESITGDEFLAILNG